jgi:tetratricopeptide (TPR) repeat protein
MLIEGMIRMILKAGHQLCFGLLIVMGGGLVVPALAQNRVGGINNIEKPPTGASEYGPREPVRSVEVYRRRGPTDAGYKGLPLNTGDEINVKRGDPNVYRVIVRFDDPTLKLLKLAPGSQVRLVGPDAVQGEEGGFLGWITGKIQATTKYIQAIAPGTEYGIEVAGDRTRLIVWEGQVNVTNRGPNPQTVAVGEKQLTEAFGSSPPRAPRVPSFDEVKDLVLFGLDLDPVIRGTVTDENLQQRLHEDFIRAQFESRVQRSAVSPQINLANVYLFLGKYTEALSAYTQAEQISSRPSAIYNGRGIAWTRLRQYGAALEAFNQAIARDDESIFHNNLGNLYLMQGDGDIEKALAEYEQASQRDRANAAPHNGRGVAQLQRKELAAAETSLGTSIRLRDRAVAHSNLGNVYLLQNNLAAADTQYQQAIRLDPRDAAALNNRGVYHLKQRQYQEAIQSFEQAIQADPREVSPRIGLGLAYVGLNQFVEAVSTLIEALERDPTNRTVYRNVAYLYLTREPTRPNIQGRLEEAAARAETTAQGTVRQFIQFLQTLPSVRPEDFDQAFEQFRVRAR